MTATLLYVHGTSVRADAVERDREMFTRLYPASRVEAPAWGEENGMPMDTDFSLSLPPGSRGIGALADELDGPPEYVEAARLMVLIDDPLLELRIAAGDAAPAEVGIALPGGDDDPVGDRIRSAVDAVDLSGTGLTAAHMRAAADQLLASPATTVVGGSDDGMTLVSDALLAAGIHQAIVAGVALDEIPAAASAEVQAALVGRIDEALGTSRGIGAWASGKLVRKAADVLRKQLTPLLARFTADILMYFARREQILADFRERLDLLTDDGRTEVVILAHSLGGIAMVDLFRELDPPVRGVRHLVTAGSQASVVQLMGTSERPKRLPIPWTNFYDPADFLGFYAASVFPGAIDEEVVSGAANAHSAYWKSKKVQDHVRALLA